MNTIQAIQPKEFYWDARRYCERFDLGPEDLERVRLSMACRALQEFMEPLIASLVRNHPSMYSLRLDAPLPESYKQAEAFVKEMQRREATRLGIPLDDSASGSPSSERPPAR